LEAIGVILQQHHCAIVGGPGTGKSWLIKNITKKLRKDGHVVFVTASTGIAASNLSTVGATTIHKLTGQGFKFMFTNVAHWCQQF